MLLIKGKQIYLAPFAKDHLNDPNYLSWLRDYEVMKYIGREEYLAPISFDEVRTYVESLWQNKFCSFFAMCSSQNNAFIGTMKLNYFNETGLITRTADVGIMIGDRKFWGKGIATDGLYTLSEYAFNVLNIRKLTAGALAPNIGVIKAFRKIGFLEEGRLRKKVFFSNEYFDHVFLGCFKEELIKDE